MALRKHCRHPREQWGKCRCAWYWDGYIDGRRTYRNLGTSRAEARRVAAEIEADRLNGRARPIPVDVTIEAVAERWLDGREARGCRPQTLRSYRTSANAVMAWFGATADVRNITSEAVQEFEDHAHASRRGHGGATLAQALRGILKHAHREKLIEGVPTPFRERRTIPPNPGVRMTEDEAFATLNALSPAHWRDLAVFLALTGLRVSEALALRWDRVDFDGGTLLVDLSAEQRGRVDAPTKTRTSVRRLRLEPVVLDVLRAQPRVDERVWPYRYAAAHAAMRRALKRAGTQMRDRGWHSFRHLNSALRDRAGQSIRQAGAEMGHGANFAMTASYGWAAEAAEPVGVAGVMRHPLPPVSGS